MLEVQESFSDYMNRSKGKDNAKPRIIKKAPFVRCFFCTHILFGHIKINADRISTAADIDGRRINQRCSRANLPFPRNIAVAVRLLHT